MEDVTTLIANSIEGAVTEAGQNAVLTFDIDGEPLRISLPIAEMPRLLLLANGLHTEGKARQGSPRSHIRMPLRSYALRVHPDGQLAFLDLQVEGGATLSFATDRSTAIPMGRDLSSQTEESGSSAPRDIPPSAH